MPAPVVDLGDDASIAQLLAADARASSSRYVTQGLSALLPRRSTGSAPKPNTRFLKALVRDADSHNAALRRKEDRDRVERLRNGGQRGPDPSTKQTDEDRHWRNGKHGGERKRRRLDGGRGTTEDEDEDRRARHAKTRRHRRSRSHPRSRSRSPSNGDDEHRRRKRHREANGRRSRRDRDSDTDVERHRSHRKHKRRHSRSRSPARDHPRKERSRSSSGRKRPSKRRDSSSDPLEDIVGPLPASAADSDSAPAVRVRGRGAHKLATTTNIDAHFSSNYDPSLDVHPDEEQPDEKEDWDMALEALRDRQAWKQKHADRMRAAGFGDEDIAKWEEAGRDKDARDVRWRGRGQTREWDVGKDQQQLSDEEDQQGRLTP